MPRMHARSRVLPAYARASVDSCARFGRTALSPSAFMRFRFGGTFAEAAAWDGLLTAHARKAPGQGGADGGQGGVFAGMFARSHRSWRMLVRNVSKGRITW